MYRVILMLVMLLVGCDKKVEITGQVFVVTKGQQNIKLALVNVVAIPEKEMIQYMGIAHKEGIKKQSSMIESLNPIERKCVSTRNVLVTDPYYSFLNCGNESAVALAGCQHANDRMFGLFEGCHLFFKQIVEKHNYYDSGDYYFEKLPTQVAESKTDADGKFNLLLPRGKYVIAAKSSRLANETEKYFWLVWVDTASPNHSVMLSNDNFYETACGGCVKPLNEPKPL